MHSVPLLEELVIPRLAALLMTYGLQTLFNICLAHRHFALLNQDEQVVRLRSAETELPVSHVFHDGLPNSETLEKYRLQMPENPTIVPDTFLIRGNQLQSYEYSCVESESAQQTLSKIQMVPQGFLKSWSGILREYAAEDQLALTFREPENGTVPNVTVCDAEARVDVGLFSGEAAAIALSWNSLPAEWEVKGRLRDGMCSCTRTRFCRCCIYCGGSNIVNGVCQDCKAPQ